MSSLRVLYITNNHPDVWIGGCEVYSYELFRGMKESGEVQPFLLARTTAPGYSGHRSSPFHRLNGSEDQILWSMEGYNHFYMTSRQKAQYTVHFANLLQALRPEVVHLQHTHGLGLELIRQIRTTLPGVPIVYTLHEFLPLCFADGLLLRRTDGGLCQGPSPARCHHCFPHARPQEFFLREHFIKSRLREVDLFLAPSQQLLERYIDWGLPRERLRFLDYGRRPVPALLEEKPPPRGHFGFFGQITRHKGILVLLEAMRLLEQEGAQGVRLFINGANLETQPEAVRQQVEEYLRESRGTITSLGSYNAAELPTRMAQVAWSVVPSIWWENSPLVIQEAFLYRRPVICSDIGGMAEKVDDGVNGLHFQVANARALADTLYRAATEDGLWERLQAATPDIFSIDDAVTTHLTLYRSLLAEGEIS